MAPKAPGAVFAALLFAACRSSGPASPDAAACMNAYQRVTSDKSGHELAVAYREHPPTDGERAAAAALWAVLIRGAHDDQIDRALFEKVATAAPLSEIPGRYPTAFRGCASSSGSSASGAIISNPFQCSDDCLISMSDINSLLVDPLVNALKALGGLSAVYGEALQMTDALKTALADPASAGQSIQETAAAAISQESAGALLAAIFDAIGQAAAVTAAVVELAGAADIAPVIAGVGAIIGLGVYAAKLKELADRIVACRDWKAKNCACPNGMCGCADIGASARGVLCCAQGGPTADGSWGVITASSTCCVLNRAEYSKHSEMCYTPPDKAPGRCPSCTSDGQCCDRTGPEGNIDRCIGGRCCGPDGVDRPGTATMVDFSCCSGVRYVLNDATRQCAPAP